jgi:hypothetical protein
LFGYEFPFVDTRARWKAWLCRKERVIGLVCGSRSGGIEVKLSNEATTLFEDYDKAEILMDGGFDPELPIRELSLTFHGAPLIGAGRNSVEAWPHFLREAVGATIGGDAWRPFFRLTTVGSHPQSWAPASPLWMRLREDFLGAMPSTSPTVGPSPSQRRLIPRTLARLGLTAVSK